MCADGFGLCGRDFCPIAGNVLMNEWQPIETAPKYNCVLLWNGDFLTIGMFNRTLDAFVDLAEHSGGVGFEDEPTHWMPLPDPPKASP